MWWTHFKKGKPSQVFNFMPFLKLWTNSNPGNLKKKKETPKTSVAKKAVQCLWDWLFLSANCCPLSYASVWFMYLTACVTDFKKTLLKDWLKIIIPIFKNRYRLGQSKGSGSLQSNPSHPSRQLRCSLHFQALLDGTV